MLLITAGPNAISVSLSPCNNYALVGLAAKRFTWNFSPKQVSYLVEPHLTKFTISGSITALPSLVKLRLIG